MESYKWHLSSLVTNQDGAIITWLIHIQKAPISNLD